MFGNGLRNTGGLSTGINGFRTGLQQFERQGTGLFSKSVHWGSGGTVVFKRSFRFWNGGIADSLPSSSSGKWFPGLTSVAFQGTTLFKTDTISGSLKGKYKLAGLIWELNKIVWANPCHSANTVLMLLCKARTPENTTPNALYDELEKLCTALPSDGYSWPRGKELEALLEGTFGYLGYIQEMLGLRGYEALAKQLPGIVERLVYGIDRLDDICLKEKYITPLLKLLAGSVNANLLMVGEAAEVLDRIARLPYVTGDQLEKMLSSLRIGNNPDKFELLLDVWINAVVCGSGKGRESTPGLVEFALSSCLKEEDNRKIISQILYYYYSQQPDKLQTLLNSKDLNTVKAALYWLERVFKEDMVIRPYDPISQGALEKKYAGYVSENITEILKIVVEYSQSKDPHAKKIAESILKFARNNSFRLSVDAKVLEEMIQNSILDEKKLLILIILIALLAGLAD